MERARAFYQALRAANALVERAERTEGRKKKKKGATRKERQRQADRDSEIGKAQQGRRLSQRDGKSGNRQESSL